MRSVFKYASRIILIVSITALFIFPEGCEKNVDIEIDEIEHMIVLNASLVPDSAIEVTLSRTRHILDGYELKMLSGGTVQISDDLGNAAQLLPGVDGIYRTAALLPVAGREYTVKASVEGYADVEAKTKIPELIPIASFDTSLVEGEGGYLQYNFRLTIDDPADEENFYSIFFHSLSYNAEMLIEEKVDTLYVSQDTVIIAKTLDTTLIYHPFYNQVYINSEDIVVEEDIGREIGIIFSDKLFNGKSYTLKGSFSDYSLLYSADTATLYYSLKSITRDYYKYLYSLEKHYSAKDDFFSTPVMVQTNITGGVGIFGSYSVYTDSLKFAPMENPFPWYY
ncbi:MAG: DUF4249 domain-containing protein [Bacteroidota bacterium]